MRDAQCSCVPSECMTHVLCAPPPPPPFYTPGSSPTTYMSRVASGLYVGGLGGIRSSNLLRSHNVTHVLNVAGRVRDACLCLGVRPFPPHQLTPCLGVCVVAGGRLRACRYHAP